MRKADGEILQSRVSPRETAFEKRLYSYTKVPVSKQQALEKEFFNSEIDDKAAPILARLLSGDVSKLSESERIEWCRFLIASRIRVPEIVNDLRESGSVELKRSLIEDHDEFLAAKGHDDAATLVEWAERNFVGLIDNFGMMILPRVIMDPQHSALKADT